MASNNDGPPQGGAGVPLGDSSVTRESTTGAAPGPRAQGAGVADAGAVTASVRSPLGSVSGGSASGVPYRPPGSGPVGRVPPGIGDAPGGVSPDGGSLAGTPSPPNPVGLGVPPRETPRGFVPPGSDAPTEEWKKAMQEAVSGLLTPMNQRLSFIEDSLSRRRPRGRLFADTSSGSTTDYSGGDTDVVPDRRPRPRPMARALLAQPGPMRVAVRVIPEKIVPADDRFKTILDCETYALNNKDICMTEKQAQGMGKKRKDVAALFGRDCEWSGNPPLGVFEFLSRFVKAANDNNISEARALQLLPEFTKDPLKRDLYRARPSINDGRTGEVSSYLELVNYLLRRYGNEHLLNEQESEFNTAAQKDDGDEDAFYARLMVLHAKCGYIQTPGQLRARFIQAIWWEIRPEVRTFVRDHPSSPVEMVVEVARQAGEHRRRLEAAEETKKAQEAAERAIRRATRRTVAAVTFPPREAGEDTTTGRPSPRVTPRPPYAVGRKGDKEPGKYPCGACNSTQHWTRLCPTLPESVPAQMSRARAARLAAREQRTSGHVVAATTHEVEKEPSGGPSRSAEPEGGSPEETESSSGNE